MNLFKIMETSFDNYDMSVKQYLSKMLNSIGETYSRTQIFGVIFEGIKGVCQNIMFYIEDALTEQNVFMASRKKSVYSLAKISGFEPSYGSCACGTLIASIIPNDGLESNVENNFKSNKLYISNHSQIKNNTTGMIYILELPTDNYVVDVTKHLVKHEFKIVEGRFLNLTYTAMGYALENVSLNSATLVDRNYIKVYVDGEEWEEVGNLYEMQEDSKNYVLQSGFDSTFDIIFGNGQNGRKLVEGQTVTVSYLVHSGDSGNVLTSETQKFVFETRGYDSYGNSVDINNYIQLSSNGFISGGTNSDEIETVRSMIGFNSRSNVLANEDNFKLFFKRFSFIGYSNIWSEKNSMTITANLTQDISKLNKDYYSLKAEDFMLTQDQKNIVQQVLENSKKSFAGITVRYIEPIIRKYSIICYVKCESNYAKDTVKTSVQDAIRNYFMNLKNNTLFIPKSDIINAVTLYDSNIKSFDFYFISELGEKTFEQGYYNKYILEYKNGTYEYNTKKVMYEEDNVPGLDYYGNISLDSKLEIPIISGISRYFPDKRKNESIRLEPINFIFI